MNYIEKIGIWMLFMGTIFFLGEEPILVYTLFLATGSFLFLSYEKKEKN